MPEYVPGHGLLAGKTVLVTAAAGTGIGFAGRASGASRKARGRHLRQARAPARRDRRRELGVPGIPCDVTDEDVGAGAVRRPRPTSSARIDVLVNNAGLGGTAELHEMTDEQWYVVLDVTLNGTFRCTRAALQPHVRATAAA